MTPQALLALIANGEDSRHQFKRDVAHTDALAAELVALANTAGVTSSRPSTLSQAMCAHRKAWSW